MCNLGEGLVEKGIKQGIENERVKNIKSLMKNCKQTYDFIAQMLELTQEETEKYRTLILH